MVISEGARSSGVGFVRSAEAAAPGPATVIARTMSVFRRELGELQRMRREAERGGRIVTQADIRLRFERHGLLLQATDGQTVVSTKQPEPSIPETTTIGPGSSQAPGASSTEPVARGPDPPEDTTGPAVGQPADDATATKPRQINLLA